MLKSVFSPRNGLSLNLNRLLNTSPCTCGTKKEAFRENKLIKKFVYGTKTGRKKWYMDQDRPRMTTVAALTATNRRGKDANRRVTVLNDLFMKNISDLMSTGEISEELIGKGLELSRVKVTPDLMRVNVYWTARGDSNCVELERILSRSAGAIRHELSQLRLMGEVPVIKFVRDRHYDRAIEVEQLLEQADFGEDFIPTTTSSLLSKDFGNGDTNADESLPTMRHDVFGLNHDELMEKIRRRLNKGRAAWERYEMRSIRDDVRNGEPAVITESPDRIIHSMETQKSTSNQPETIDKAELTRFLEKRRIEKYARKRQAQEEAVNLTVKTEEPDYDDRDHFADLDKFIRK